MVNLFGFLPRCGKDWRIVIDQQKLERNLIRQQTKTLKALR